MKRAVSGEAHDDWQQQPLTKMNSTRVVESRSFVTSPPPAGEAKFLRVLLVLKEGIRSMGTGVVKNSHDVVLPPERTPAEGNKNNSRTPA